MAPERDRAAPGEQRGGANERAAVSARGDSRLESLARMGARRLGSCSAPAHGVGALHERGDAAARPPQTSREAALLVRRSARRHGADPQARGMRLAVRTRTVRLLAVFLLLAASVPPTANANANMQQHARAHAPGALSADARRSPRSPPAALHQPPPYCAEAPAPSSAFDAEEEDVALLVDLDDQRRRAAGGASRVTIASVHQSLLVLLPEGSPVQAHDALRVGDEIVSIDDIPAAEVGAHGVQALVREAGADPLRLAVRRAGDKAAAQYLVQLPASSLAAARWPASSAGAADR
jgi:hypothetical protein